MIRLCKDCKKEVPKYHSYCEECFLKRRRKATIECRKKSYKENPELRKRILEENRNWCERHPFRSWSISAIRNHRRRNINILFSISELEELAKRTNVCRICGIVLNYGRKGRSGFVRNSPSLDNKFGKENLSFEDIEIICSQCNVSKQKMTLEEFIEYCKSIVYRFE